MSDTPRTDELEFEIQGDFVVYADECRQIERELAEAYERAAQVCDKLEEARSWQPGEYTLKAAAAAIRALKSKTLLGEMVRDNQKAGLYDL